MAIYSRLTHCNSLYCCWCCSFSSICRFIEPQQIFPPSTCLGNFFSAQSWFPNSARRRCTSVLIGKCAVSELPAIWPLTVRLLRTYSHSRSYSTEIFLIDFLPTTPLPPFFCAARMLFDIKRRGPVASGNFPALDSTESQPN